VAPLPEKPAGKPAKAVSEEASLAAKREEDFRNDPLIHEALRIFDAKISQVK
jgi:hypothetical protein